MTFNFDEYNVSYVNGGAYVRKNQRRRTTFKKYRIQYNEINTTLRLKPQRAVEMCQDTAVCHSDEAGYTLDFFTENHCGWVLTGWHIIFGKLPKEGEDIDLATWTRPYKRLQADRSFRATDMDGNEIFRAMSRWFLFDTEKRRPKRFHSDFFDLMFLLNWKLQSLKKITLSHPLSCTSFQIPENFV